MLALVMILSGVVLVLLVVVVFAAAALRRKTEIAAMAMADSFAREAKRVAEEKAKNAADAAVKEIENATHEDLLKRARDLVRRK